MLVAGLTVFTGASLVGGLAWGPGSLVAARALQGVGAAMVAPSTLSILTTAYPHGPRRARALAVCGALGSLGGSAGSVLGGVLTELMSWRSILLVNVLAGAVLVPAAVRTLAGMEPPTAARGRLDLPGAILATTGVATTTYAIGRFQQHAWTDPPSLAWLACGVACLTAFVAVELRSTTTPLFPLTLLRVRSVSVGNAVTLLSGACLQIPVWYFLTFFMQDVLDFSPLQTGLGFLPHTLLGVVLGIGVTPCLMRRVPARLLVALGAHSAAHCSSRR